MRERLLPTLATLLAAVLVYLLAWQLVHQGINREAQSKAALLQAGHTPWDFAPRTASDLIAGRAFGAVEITPGESVLGLRSLDSSGYELGLPLPYPLDLKKYSRARLSMETTAPTTASWLLRERLDGPLLVSRPMDMTPGERELTLNLGELEWVTPGSDQIGTLPATAAMLRLKLQHPAGSTTRLHSVQWLTADHPDFTDDLPVKMLDRRGVEAMLAQRDAVRRSAPATVIVASPDGLKTDPENLHNDSWWALLAWLAYGPLFAWTGWQTHRQRAAPRTSRILPLSQIIVCVGPLVVWATGMYGDPDPGPAWLLALLAGLTFGLWLAWRSHGRDWRWLYLDGRVRWSDWRMPALTTLLTLALLLAFNASPQLPPPKKLLVYAAWAAMQQILILAVLAPRMRLWLDTGWPCALALAMIFALAHAPNAMLMELSLLAELLWAWQFLRRPVLLPIITAHAAAGLMLMTGLADLPLRSLEVGARFLQ